MDQSKFILVFFLISISNILFAQGTTSAGSSGNSGLIADNVRAPSKIKKGYISYDEILAEYDNYNGSPFLHGKEITVDFIHTDGTIIPNVNILYDLYYNEIILENEKDESVVLDQVYFTGFFYNNNGDIEEYVRLYDGEKTRFCKILFKNDDITFARTLRLRISEPPTPIPGVDIKKREFLSQQQYYLVTKTKTNEVPLKNEKLVNFLPNKYKSQVQKLKRKLKIRKLRKEKDYVRLMKAFLE